MQRTLMQHFNFIAFSLRRRTAAVGKNAALEGEWRQKVMLAWWKTHGDKQKMFVYFGGNSGFMSADFVPSCDSGLETDILVYYVFCFVFFFRANHTKQRRKQQVALQETKRTTIQFSAWPEFSSDPVHDRKERHDARFFPARSVSGSSYETHHGPWINCFTTWRLRFLFSVLTSLLFSVGAWSSFSVSSFTSFDIARPAMWVSGKARRYVDS